MLERNTQERRYFDDKNVLNLNHPYLTIKRRIKTIAD